MDAKLTVVGGKASKSRVSIKLPTVIGRSREADLTVAHPMVSRKHCELYEVDGLLMIRDLGSLNGLYVGGKQVSEAALRPNAEFAVGPLTFRVEYEFTGEISASLEANTVDEETPEAEVLPKAEAIPEAEIGPEAGDFDLEVTEVEPEGPEEAEVDLDVGDFDLNVDEADPEPAEPDPEATEFDPEMDGFRLNNGPPDPDPRKTVACEETLGVQEQPADAEPDPGPAETQPTVVPPTLNLNAAGDVPGQGAVERDDDSPKSIPEIEPTPPKPPGGPQPPKIAPQGTDEGTVAWQPNMDEETVDDEPPYFTPPAEPPPGEPDQEDPQDEDLNEFLKGFE